MIIAENKNNKVVSSHDFDSVNCTIDAEDMRYVASLLRNNYSNTQLAVIREISANALDANTEAKSNRKIEISLPSKLNTNFCVRDFGGGLSQEDVFSLYSKYGKSTKRTSNNYIGAFGIGKFAPLSYGDNFTCVSYNGGLKTSYNIFVDEHDDTKIVKLHEEPTNEPTGLEVQVAISESDIESFRDSCKKFFKFFSSKDMPKFRGADQNFIVKPKIILEGKGEDWFFSEQENSYSYYNRSYGKAQIIMGRVAYPLDADSINIKNYVEDERQIKIIESVLQEQNFHLRVPLGCVKLHHSREALEYNKPTQKFIVQLMVEVVSEIKAIASEKLSDSKDLYEAKANYARIINSLPQTLQRAFQNSFEWKGIKVDSFGFSRPYGMVEDLAITETTKESDSDARNGFRVRSQKTTRINCREDGIFVIQDIKSSHGNNLRARTLFNENAELRTIFFINPITDDGQGILDNEWHFDKISDKHIRYTSKIEKEKPLRSGVRKSNGSRANIQLFEMTDQNVYRNIDFWKSVDEDINKLQEDEDAKGLVNGKFIYIPIKNYKIDIDDLDLNRTQKQMCLVRRIASNDSQERSFRLFGIRSSDTKNLDSSSWVSFVDFYKDFAKSYLKENLSRAKQAYKLELFNQSNLASQIRNDSYALSKIFNSSSCDSNNDLSEDHLFRSLREDVNVILNRQVCNYCESFIVMLMKSDKDWLEFNLDSGFTAKQFKKNIDTINKKYPMLEYASYSVNSYGKNDQKVYEDMLNYIKVCDKI